EELQNGYEHAITDRCTRASLHSPPNQRRRALRNVCSYSRKSYHHGGEADPTGSVVEASGRGEDHGRKKHHHKADDRDNFQATPEVLARKRSYITISRITKSMPYLINWQAKRKTCPDRQNRVHSLVRLGLDRQTVVHRNYWEFVEHGYVYRDLQSGSGKTRRR